MNDVLDLAAVGRTFRVLLERGGMPLVFHDRASGQDLAVDFDTAASPAGLLPAFLAAGAAVWREATGKEFGVVVTRDQDALLGYRVQDVRAGMFSAVMLSVMEATVQITGPEVVRVNDLGALWSAAAERSARPAPRPSAGATMRLHILPLALVLALAGAGAARGAEAPGAGGASVVGCIEAASAAHRLPPAVLVILLNVEGGALGRVSHNTNGTVDIGPMQVNQVWLTQLAAHWRASREASYAALRDSFCANVEAGAWILRRGLDEARGDFWEGVGYYHSHDPGYKADYLRKVLQQATRLQARALREVAPPGVRRTVEVPTQVTQVTNEPPGN